MTAAAILRIGCLDSVALSRFVDSRAPGHHIFMDASDRGLCALWPARKEYLQVEFDEEELQQIEKGNVIGADELSINIRELMRGVFAPVVWASKWSQAVPDYHTHIRFWIDKSSAVCWANRRSSRNPFAQMLLRLIALLDVQHNFYSSARHIAGCDNVMADAGSRVGVIRAALGDIFSHVVCLDTGQSPIEPKELWKLWELGSELEL
ncbi:hypothetical protein PC121_g16353 [Phytophthora cactorum]|nr:hypothetical protein PC120_g14631 [Phytophthora cactorum]KAG3054304.1 hypothetical protein PC121_g16353 [Phytophthora cactorum]KAG4050057.1 hypothetical protein PC123_g14691 [Phytophthora cactorum]